MPDVKDNNPTVKPLTIRNLQLGSTQRLNQKLVSQVLLGRDEKKKTAICKKGRKPVKFSYPVAF